MILQLFLGTMVIILNILIHAVMLYLAARVLLPAINPFLILHLRHLAGWVVLVIIILWILLAHTLEVWVWAFALLLTGSMDNLPDATYFSLVTMTSLGYGDIVLESPWRLFGALMSPNGVILFGWSSAFLVWGIQNFIAPHFTGN